MSSSKNEANNKLKKLKKKIADLSEQIMDHFKFIQTFSKSDSPTMCACRVCTRHCYGEETTKALVMIYIHTCLCVSIMD